MPVDSQTRQKLVADYRRHDKDSGSPEVQIAILCKDIDELTVHMQKHPKDHASRHGLLLKVNRRNSLVAYLNRVDRKKCQQIAERLGLRNKQAPSAPAKKSNEGLE